MNKPISIMIQEFNERLAALLNESGLTAVLMRPSIEHLLEAVKAVEKQQLAADREAWTKAQEEAKKEESKPEEPKDVPDAGGEEESDES